jgi:uncharacterized membrane protein
MAATSVALVLLSAFLHALWNYYSKANRSPQIFLFWVSVLTVGMAIGAFAIKTPIVPQPVWTFIIASGVVHFLYWFSLSKGYASGDISYVYPIARSAPGFIPLFAFLLLQESISVQGLLGIFCIVVSIYLLQQREDGMAFRDLIRYMRRPDAVWAFSTLGTVITYSLIDKKGMSEFYSHTSQSLVWQAVIYYLLQGAIAMLLYGVFIIYRFPRSEITEIGRRHWKRIMVTSMLVMISYSLILYVMMTEKVSYIVALRQCSVIFAVLLGTYILEESHAKLRLTAAVVMVVGVLLTSTA